MINLRKRIQKFPAIAQCFGPYFPHDPDKAWHSSMRVSQPGCWLDRINNMQDMLVQALNNLYKFR